MLDRFELKPTEDTPEIILDPENQVFKISGRSMPEDAFAFYTPVFTWLIEYVKNPNEKTDFICDLEYFNSSSAKKIVELFFILEEIKDKDVKVIWNYEKDDRLIETKGEELQILLKIPVEMVAID
ncbi:MAG: nuclear pore complex subunit [Salinivirgaceae bacterium]|nr:MAG: nuclear pore complex subunit [Salinivirgaceae bacterium]